MRKFLLSVLILVATIQSMEVSTESHRKSEIPRGLSNLDHYDIPINKSKNKFELPLTQADPYVSVNYLCNGKLVARYIAANHKIFLESLSPEGYNFSINKPVKADNLDINLYGKIRFQELVNVDGIANIKCKSLKNKNTFSAQQFCFNGQSIVNNGSIATGRCAIEKCRTIINKNNWIVGENCYLYDVEKLLTSENSSWVVGGCWSGVFKYLELSGNFVVGIAALFSVGSEGFFKGLVNVPILQGESGGTFESSLNSKFLVTHHLSLKAKDSVKWEGSIFDNLGNKLPWQKDDLSKLCQMPKKGVYLQSDEGDLHKSGIIDVSDKPVFLAAKKDLHHDKQTKAKETEHGVIVFSGSRVDLAKQSELEAYAVQLQAQESITYDGKALIEARGKVYNVSQDAVASAGAIAFEAKNISFKSRSLIDAKKVYIRAQDTIDQQGVLKISENLNETASIIEMKRDSFIRARNAFIHGAKKLSQYGKLIAQHALIMRANRLYNAGIIKAENSHFKADRCLFNRGIINTRDLSQIDALLAMNIYPGTIDAKVLKTNALGNLNLGICKTKIVDSNTILNFNMGEYLLPWNGVFSMNFEGITRNDKIKVAEQTFLLMVPPNIQAYYRLGKFWLNLGFAFDAVGRLYKEWSLLPATYSGASDLMPLLAGSFNFAFSAFQQAKSTKNLLDTIQGFYNEDGQISFPPFDIIKALQSIAASVIPGHNFKSVANVNFGTIRGFEGNFTNVFDINACGLSLKDAVSISAGSLFVNKLLFPGGLLFLNNYALNTYRGFNDGILGASTVLVSAKRSYSTGENLSMSSLDALLESCDLTLKNHLYAVAASLKASGMLSLYGNISASRKISLMAREIVLKKNSYLSALQGGIFANGKRIESAGDVSGQQVCVFGKDVVLKEGSTTQSYGSQATISILAEDFTTEHGSKITVSGNGDQADPENNKIMISAKNADLKLGTSLEACKGFLCVAAAENVQHAATVNGRRVYLQAKKDLELKEGSDTRAQGQQALVVMQAEDIKTKNGAKVAALTDTDQSNMQNSQIVISAKNADFQKGSSLNVGRGSLQVTAAENITHATTAEAQKVHMKAQSIFLKDGSDTRVHDRDLLVGLPVVTCSDGPRLITSKTASLPEISLQNEKELEIQEGGSIELKEVSNIRAPAKQPLVVLQAEDTLEAEKGAQITVSGVSIPAQDWLTLQDPDPAIILHGGKKIDLQQGSHFDPLGGATMITGGDATIAASMKGVVLARTKNLLIEENNGTDLRRVRAFAEEKILQKGILTTLDFFMRAKYIENCGKINGKKGIIKADRWYWNTGTVISEDLLDITAPASINWISHTKTKRLTTNALLDINLLSIDETQILDNKALLSLDLSLHLPLLTDDTFSDESIKNAGKKALLMVLPPHLKLIYKLVNFLSRIPDMASDLQTLRQDVRKLYKDPTAGASDWVPLINKAVSLVLSAKQGCGLAQEVYGELAPACTKADEKKPTEEDISGNTDSNTQNSDEYKNSNTENNISDKTDEKVPLISHTSKGLVVSLKTLENVKEAGAAVASIGGALINQHHNRQSLVDLNYGAAAAFNGSSINLWDTNTAKLYANYHLDTCYGQNLGILAGGSVSISANKYQNGISSNVGSHQIESSACIAGLNLAVKADSFKGSSGSVIATTHGASLEVKELDNEGTIHGSLNLKFDGSPEQLKSIGEIKTHGGSFSYQGPIANCDGTNAPSADELARGSGAWGTVSGASAIKFNAGEQDIHIKQTHDIQHSLHAKSAGNINVDQPLNSQHSISLHAGQNLKHDSLVAKEHIQRIAQKGNITVGSTVERVQEGANYEDKVIQRSVIAGKSNTAYAGNNIFQTAVVTKSGKEGTRFIAKGYIIDESLTYQKHTEKHSDTESYTDTHIISQGSVHASEGRVDIEAGEKYLGRATKFDAKGGTVGGLKGTEITDGKEIHEHESTKKSEAWWSSEATKEKTVTSKSVGPQFIGNHAPFVIDSGTQETVLINAQSNVPLVLKGESAKILLGGNKTVSLKENEYANYIWESEKTQPKEELIYAPIQLKGIENHTKSLLIQLVKAKTCAFLEKINNVNEGQVSAEFLEEYRHADTSSSRRLTNSARIVLGLSIGLLTQGVGSSIAAGLTSAGAGTGISTVLSHASTGTINCLINKAANVLVEADGDINKAAQRMASYQTLQEATFAAVSAGVLSGADQAMNTLGMPFAQEGRNVIKRLAYAAPREFIHMGVKTAIATLAGQPINQVLPEQLKDFATKILHNVLVAEIASLYAAHDINSLEHKVLHGIAAGTIYGGVYGNMNAALAAGLGAFSAEIAAELMAPSKNIMNVIMQADAQGYSLSQEQFMASYSVAMRDYMRNTHTAQQIGQLTAAVTALAIGQDAALAHQAALTALDNNFLVLAMYGITAASTAYSGYKIYKSYEEGGVEAALKQLGIEVVYNVAGHAAGKGIAHFGGKVYPYVEEAARAALDEAPALKLILGDLAEKLIVGAHKLNAGPIGKCVAKIESTLAEQEAKLLGKLGLKGRVPAAAEVSSAQQEAQAVEEAAVAGVSQAGQNNNFHVPLKLSLENENLLKSFNPQKYSSEIIDPEKLVKAKDLFAYTEGAMGQDGPLKRLLSIDSKRIVNNPGVLGTARGAAFELERALVLENNGNKIVQFGAKVPLINEQTNKIVSTLDVDIVTGDLFIECKNYNWGKMEQDQLPKIIEKIQSRLPELHKAALQAGKNLELHSKYEIPDNLKNWLTKKNIKFVEG